MEHPWDETDREKLKYSEKNMSQCCCAQHKSYTDWSGFEPYHPRSEVGD
jgi:hypothetical protein